MSAKASGSRASPLSKEDIRVVSAAVPKCAPRRAFLEALRPLLCQVSRSMRCYAALVECLQGQKDLVIVTLPSLDAYCASSL